MDDGKDNINPEDDFAPDSDVEGVEAAYTDPGHSLESEFGIPESDGNLEEPSEHGEEEHVEISDESSAVSSPPAKNILFIGIAIVASIYFLYTTIFSEDEETKIRNANEAAINAVPAEYAEQAPTLQKIGGSDDFAVIEEPASPAFPAPPMPGNESGFDPNSIPNIPDFPFDSGGTPYVPDLASQETESGNQVPSPMDEAPPSLPDSSNLVQPEEIDVGPTPEEVARKREKRKSSMVVREGGGRPGEGEDEKSDKGDEGYSLELTSSEQVGATSVTMENNLNLIVAQGKIIDAVLETAINTDLPGSLRAIVSRDVYGEVGRNILIPRGSRIIGTYNNTIERGQRRVYIIWDRIIRPDGIDVAVDSPATDQLGRAGASGLVDNKYFEIFGNSILLSALSIGGSILLDKVTDSQQVTQSTNVGADGGTTSSQTSNTSDAAVLGSVSSLNDVTSSIVQGFVDSEPTIFISQGTRLKVFVNKDLIFPSSFSSGLKYLN